jgi:hypothetical protein
MPSEVWAMGCTARGRGERTCLESSVATVARLCCSYRDACCLCIADVLPAERCEVLGFRV